MIRNSALSEPLDRLYVRYAAAGFERLLASGRSLYEAYHDLREHVVRRPASSPGLPDAYHVVNTRTRDSELDLQCLAGGLPDDLDGALYISQCLGTPGAYFAGEPNIVRLRFRGARARITNRRLWTPSLFAVKQLEHTRYRFRSWGFFQWSFALGMQLYPEGMGLLNDGRIMVTGDICRPYVIDPETLLAETPIGRAREWMSFALGPALKMTGRLFPIINTSQGPFCDRETGEMFTLDYRLADADPEHPVRLLRWPGHGPLESWLVEDLQGNPIQIHQSVHDVVCSRNYVLLCDTAIAVGNGIFFPWTNLPKPKPYSVIHIIDRRELRRGAARVRARRVTVPRPAISLFAEYEDPGEHIKLYMLHLAALNPVDLVRPGDVDLDGRPFPANLIGYGTLPPVDLGGLGRHILDAARGTVVESTFLEDPAYTWYPYMLSYPHRHQRHYAGQDVFILFRGYHPSLLPKRMLEQYRDTPQRRVPLERLIGSDAIRCPPSICRISTERMEIVDAFQFPERVHCHTQYYIDPTHGVGEGYVLAAVVTDSYDPARSSGQEYWLFRADRLSEGPICRLGHVDLDNTTVFHGVYIPERHAPAVRPDVSRYHIPIREDYPEEDLRLWGEPVLRLFREKIYPYYDRRAAEPSSETPP